MTAGDVASAGRPGRRWGARQPEVVNEWMGIILINGRKNKRRRSLFLLAGHEGRPSWSARRRVSAPQPQDLDADRQQEE